MTKFYYLQPPDDSTIATIAEEVDIEFIDELSESEVPVRFNTTEYLPNSILANDLGWPLISSDFKDIIDSKTCDCSHFTWHEVNICVGEDIFIYYVPVFISDVDVLDRSCSIYAEGGFVVKACVSSVKADGIKMFPVPGSDSRVIISEDIYLETIDAGIDITHFEKVATTVS